MMVGVGKVNQFLSVGKSRSDMTPCTVNIFTVGSLLFHLFIDFLSFPSGKGNVYCAVVYLSFHKLIIIFCVLLQTLYPFFFVILI